MSKLTKRERVLVEALEHLEWRPAMWNNDEEYCGACGGWRPEHNAGCWLDVLLSVFRPTRSIDPKGTLFGPAR